MHNCSNLQYRGDDQLRVNGHGYGLGKREESGISELPCPEALDPAFVGKRAENQ